MATQQQTPHNVYTGNGSSTVFNYTFKVMAASDLIVSLNGAAQSSGFTVTGVNASAGGTVVFTTPPAAGVQVIVQRVIALDRPTDYQTGGDLFSDALNSDFDRLWLAMQEVSEQCSRAVKSPIGSAQSPDGLIAKINAAAQQAETSATTATNKANEASALASSAITSAAAATAAATAAASAALAAGGGATIFTGIRMSGANLLVDYGAGDWNASNYIDHTFMPETTTFSINAANQLVATF